MAWPGLKPTSIFSIYLETGGKITPLNLQILSDTGKQILEDGKPFAAGGDWQIEGQQLLDLGWVDLIHGMVRAGDSKMGTCTVASPPTNIEYFVMHTALSHMVPEAEIDLDSRLAPHRPVRSFLQLRGGEQNPCAMRGQDAGASGTCLETARAAIVL